MVVKMATEIWNVDLTKSVNGIDFGLSRKEVRKRLNREYKEFKKGLFSKSITDDYIDFHVFYDKSDRFIAIEVFSNVSVLVNDRHIFPGGIDQAIAILPDLKKDGEGYISYKNSVGIYAPEETIESILFGKENYYQHIAG